MHGRWARLPEVMPPLVRDCLQQGFEELWDAERGMLREAGAEATEIQFFFLG